jgi:hypothetical protein
MDHGSGVRLGKEPDCIRLLCERRGRSNEIICISVQFPVCLFLGPAVDRVARNGRLNSYDLLPCSYGRFLGLPRPYKSESS